MKDLERRIREMDASAARLPLPEVQRLDMALRDLTPQQRVFVRKTLDHARSFEKTSPSTIYSLTYFFDKWNTHSLPTKLALIQYLLELADGQSWPDHPTMPSQVTETINLLQDVQVQTARKASQPTVPVINYPVKLNAGHLTTVHN